MKRLTTRGFDGDAHILDASIEDALNRLAAYEETGMTPEGITELQNWTYGPLHKKIGQWIRADSENRIILLPCAIGTHLWKVTYPYRRAPKVTEFVVKNIRTTGKRHRVQIEVQAVNVPGTSWMVFDKFYLTKEEAEKKLEKELKGDLDVRKD